MRQIRLLITLTLLLAVACSENIDPAPFPTANAPATIDIVAGTATPVATLDQFAGTPIPPTVTVFSTFTSEPPSTLIVRPTEGSPTITPTPAPAASMLQPNGIYISEVLMGKSDNADAEFIELYNSSDRVVDLADYSIALAKSEWEQDVIYTFPSQSELAPFGHYLIGRQYHFNDILADGQFGMPLVETGSLILRDSQELVVDLFAWGNASAGTFAEKSADSPLLSQSLERLPGGEQGNGSYSGNNSVDLVINTNPNPQNSGSENTPSLGQQLLIEVETTDEVYAGESFQYTVTVTNVTEIDVKNIRYGAPIPSEFTLINSTGEPNVILNFIEWETSSLWPGQSESQQITLEAGYNYTNHTLRGAYVVSDAMPTTLGKLKTITISSGTTPIGVARGLSEAIITIEGVTTVSTDHFDTDALTKTFYVEDETGGIQISVNDPNNELSIDTGERVRVRGKIASVRDTVFLFPVTGLEDITTIESLVEPKPIPISIVDNIENRNIIGRLNQIEGTITRIHESPTTYDLDITDADGNSTLVLIDKVTGVDAESIHQGERYSIIGISEEIDGTVRIKPRETDDVSQRFPNELRVERIAPSTVRAGGSLDYDIEIGNFTNKPIFEINITAQVPAGTTWRGTTADGQRVKNVTESIVWQIPRLDPDQTITVSYFVTVATNRYQPIIVPEIFVSSPSYRDNLVLQTKPFTTYVGDKIPVWAVQGNGDFSPYWRREAVVEGIVTAVFPNLGGFFLQEQAPDGDPKTSPGIFVTVNPDDDENVNIWIVNTGDLVRVSGVVRELSGLTTLVAAGESGVQVNGKGSKLPAPVNFDPPRDYGEALIYKEALEGTLVKLKSPAVVLSPSNTQGEFVLLYEQWGLSTVSHTDDTGFLITVDDGSNLTHKNRDSLPYFLGRGDRVTELTGILSFDNGQFKIEPISAPKFTRNDTTPNPLSLLKDNQFSVATFNVNGLIDTNEPHPENYAEIDEGEYRQKLSKLAETIAQMGGPSIVALQEVENMQVLWDLLEQPRLADFGYTPVFRETAESADIHLAFLTRNGQVLVQSNETYPEWNGVAEQHPFVIKTAVSRNGNTQNIYVINNQFTSIEEGAEITLGRRTAQANWVISVMTQIRETDLGAQFIVLGDLSSHLNTLPLQKLQETGLKHVYDKGLIESPYTYISNGQAISPDHMLVSDSIFNQLVEVHTPHYNSGAPIIDPRDFTPKRASDHDPLLAIFDFR